MKAHLLLLKDQEKDKVRQGFLIKSENFTTCKENFKEVLNIKNNILESSSSQSCKNSKEEKSRKQMIKSKVKIR